LRGKLFFRLAAALTLAFLLSGTADGGANAQEPPSDSPKVDPEVLHALESEAWVDVFVALRELPAATAAPLDLPVLRQQVAAYQGDVLSGLTGADFQLVDRYDAIPSLFGRVSAAGAAKLAADPNVLRIYRPLELHFTLAQSVPLINADDVQAAGYTGAGVVTATLDSGVDTDHSDLQDDLIGQHCFEDYPLRCPNHTHEQHGAGSAEDSLGHGTHVAGIITSGGIVAAKGVAPDAKLIAFRVGGDNGQNAISTSGALKALDYIIAHPEYGIRIINMSFGAAVTTPPPCDALDPAWATALTTLRTAGVIAFVASGNGHDKSHVDFPACLSAAVSVGAVYDANWGSKTWCANSSCTPILCTDATTAADKVTCFSNSYPQLDLLAPGAIIRSSYLYNTATNMSGTSMAAPHAAGVAALMLQADPAATPDELKSCMKSSGVQVTDPANGVTTPRVDAAGAVTCVGGGPICPISIGNGRGIPGDDATDPNFNFIPGDCDRDGLSNADELSGAACGGKVTDPGPDITYDDDNDGNPFPPLGTDASDDPAAWDTDGDGVRDGFECAHGFDPTDPTSRPSVQQCGGTGDTDGDGLLDAWENCKWGTNPTVVDTDGDTLGDCVEAADVNGDGQVDFGEDTMDYARSALLPLSAFGTDGDFDLNGDGVVDFGADVIQEAKFALFPGLCK
jgi:subtilisin family serine protease